MECTTAPFQGKLQRGVRAKCQIHRANPKMLTLCRGTSLISNRPHLGPYGRPMPRALWWSSGARRSHMSEVPLCPIQVESALDRFEEGLEPPRRPLCKKDARVDHSLALTCGHLAGAINVQGGVEGLYKPSGCQWLQQGALLVFLHHSRASS